MDGKNFLPEALAIAERLGYDTIKKFTGRAQESRRKETISGFVSVPDLKTNEKQISKIKYLPKTGQWRGLIVLSKSKNEFVYLNDNWVKENVLASTYDLAKKAAESAKLNFFILPPGYSSKHALMTAYHPLAPVIYYKQED